MVADFLQLDGKTILVMGVANKKSVAWHIGRVLVEAGARVTYAVRSPERREQVQPLVGDADVFVCDVEHEDQIERLAREVAERCDRLDGLVHSIAFADYSEGPRPFHEMPKQDFLRAVDISCYSLVAVSGALKDLLATDASVVTVSISTTRMAAENYGFMAPIKAALDSSLVFAGAVQCRGPGTAENFGLGRHPGLRGFLPLRRASDASQTGNLHRRSGQCGRVSAQSALQRHQRPAACGGRRDERELLRRSLGAGHGGRQRT
jgi:Enoyl-(Acyl carrier protein) reductase